jgi:hypothetical protein
MHVIMYLLNIVTGILLEYIDYYNYFFYCKYRFPWGAALKEIRINLAVNDSQGKL